jgi:hypothetical protein
LPSVLDRARFFDGKAQLILPASILMLIHPHAAFIGGQAIATAFATVALMTQAIRTAKRGLPLL